MNNQMYVDWIMDSYGLKENQRNVAEMVADKLDVYRMSMEDQYGLTEANWSNAITDPYDESDDDDNWDDDPLDNWKSRKEDEN